MSEMSDMSFRSDLTGLSNYTQIQRKKSGKGYKISVVEDKLDTLNILRI